ncbi:CBASS cGAMP-activated phospholipase [Paenibacillus barengoltzii]|uniref:Patatin n=1 Tax=Paenibacillus barengoltzii J12 TaxID=935846 RepID=A0ABY1LZM2_9BACL|nr:CBASS cGAMP-activated phospholipase [Paenibacillus barengoltzii]SMF41799.1 Patatin [Paenibacillus barengoltzii J12]
MPGCYRILAIDGGGIKGLYSAVILEEIEKVYGPVYQNFNLICGTSTGGIIALALASGMPASDIVRFYKEKGPSIFPYQNPFFRKIHYFKQILIKSKYSSNQLKLALEEVFQDKKIEDCKTTVLIPTVNVTTGSPYVFKSDHQPTLTRDSKRLLSEVALATTAAPTYFPIVELQTKEGPQQFVDGGLWANNPSLLGMQEYFTYYLNKGFDSYCLLSISSLNEHARFPEPHKVWKSKSFSSWGNKLISTMIDTQSFAVDNHMKFITKYLPGHYVRITSTELSDQEKKYIELDRACPTAISIMLDKGVQASKKWLFEDSVRKIFEYHNQEDEKYVKLS